MTFEFTCGRVTLGSVHAISLTVYRLGSVLPNTQFYTDFETLIAKVLGIAMDVYIVGDINIRLY